MTKAISLKAAVLLTLLCCLLSGCTSQDITGDIDVGDITTGNIDVGIYVKTNANDIYSIEWKYDDNSGSLTNMSGSAIETDTYHLLTSEIVSTVVNEKRPVQFTITAKKKAGEVFAEQNFTYEEKSGRMELTILEDGTIQK